MLLHPFFHAIWIGILAFGHRTNHVSAFVVVRQGVPPAAATRPRTSTMRQEESSTRIELFDHEPSHSGRSHSTNNPRQQQKQQEKDDIVLPSVFDADMPAGLRGEAVRSALQSGRCVAWCFSADASPLAHGLVHVQGAGWREFLQNKLSNSFLRATTTTTTTTPTDDKSASSSSSSSSFRRAAVLTARGRIIDAVGVAYHDDDDDNDDDNANQQLHQQAWIQTSPGHKASDLYARWDPFVFPMDQVQLSVVPNVVGISVASVSRQDVIQVFYTHIYPQLRMIPKRNGLLLLFFANHDVVDNLTRSANDKNQCVILTDPTDGSLQLLVTPCIHLPECAAVGYTFWIFDNDKDEQLGQSIWQYLNDQETNNDKSVQEEKPIIIGAAEYESLRIQAGYPAYGLEMTGRNEKHANATSTTPATPLELHQGDELIDMNKGCYMGQEGIASILKNPRGPPRLLYQVVFGDEFNLYNHNVPETAEKQTTSNGMPMVENLTRLPRVGDTLYVLGSNQDIAVGTLTSVAEPSSTGDAETVALALVRRADSILKAMKKHDLEIPRHYNNLEEDQVDDSTFSGVIAPPPMDPLDGLEVIIEGTFTIGTLRSVPSRRLPPGQNMFTNNVPDFVRDLPLENDDAWVDITRVPLAGGLATGEIYEPKRSNDTVESSVASPLVQEETPMQVKLDQVSDQHYANVDDDDDDEDQADTQAALEQARLEAQAAQAAAEEAAAEAERKAAKMEMLRQRAQEAMARRNAKKTESKKD